MADPLPKRARFSLTFVGLVSLVLFVQILPLKSSAGGLPGPDIMILIAFTWVLYRPDYVPVWLLGGVFFVADLLLLRPPGLWAALVVLGAEFVRSRSVGMRDARFVLDWALIAVVVLTIGLLNQLVLAIFVVERPNLAMSLVQIVATIAVFPLVAILAGRAFGLRKIAPGEVDVLGHRQ